MQVPTSVLTPTLVEHEPFSEPERFALAGFLAGYSGLTHEAYALDLRQYATYCADHHLALFEVKRAHIEAFARQLEAMGRARATIARRLCTITCFYRCTGWATRRPKLRSATSTPRETATRRSQPRSVTSCRTPNLCARRAPRDKRAMEPF